MGQGYNQAKARESFDEALQEFFCYTINKKTLDKVLVQLGWTIKGSKKKPKFIPPKNSDLVTSNSLYSEIVNNKNHKVSRESIEIPLH